MTVTIRGGPLLQRLPFKQSEVGLVFI